MKACSNRAERPALRTGLGGFHRLCLVLGLGVLLSFGIAFCVEAALGLTAARAQSLGETLAKADPAKGEASFGICAACHSIEKGAPPKIGPNLWGIVGGPVANEEGYAYSDALKAYGGDWDVDRLDAYLENPQKAVPGTRMPFGGLPKAAERANIIAYMNTKSDAPLDLAKAPGSDAKAAAAEDGGADQKKNLGLLVDKPGAEKVFAYCTPCHSERIVVQQGKTRKHWDELLDWMVEEQGMAEIPEPDKTVVLDYLALNYGEDRPNFPR